MIEHKLNSLLNIYSLKIPMELWMMGTRIFASQRNGLREHFYQVYDYLIERELK